MADGLLVAASRTVLIYKGEVEAKVKVMVVVVVVDRSAGALFMLIQDDCCVYSWGYIV